MSNPISVKEALNENLNYLLERRQYYDVELQYNHNPTGTHENDVTFFRIINAIGITVGIGTMLINVPEHAIVVRNVLGVAFASMGPIIKNAIISDSERMAFEQKENQGFEKKARDIITMKIESIKKALQNKEHPLISYVFSMPLNKKKLKLFSDALYSAEISFELLLFSLYRGEEYLERIVNLLKYSDNATKRGDMESLKKINGLFCDYNEEAMQLIYGTLDHEIDKQKTTKLLDGVNNGYLNVNSSPAAIDFSNVPSLFTGMVNPTITVNKHSSQMNMAEIPAERQAVGLYDEDVATGISRTWYDDSTEPVYDFRFPNQSSVSQTSIPTSDRYYEIKPGDPYILPTVAEKDNARNIDDYRRAK